MSQRAKPEAEQGEEPIKHTEISRIGHILSNDGVKPDPKKVDAITRMETTKEFHKLKQAVAEAAIPKYFDPKKPVKVSVDAS